MEIRGVILAAVQAVTVGVKDAKKDLEGKATIDFPTKIEIEFGINSSYEIANFDDFGSLIAKVKVHIPIFEQHKPDAGKIVVTKKGK